MSSMSAISLHRVARRIFTDEKEAAAFRFVCRGFFSIPATNSLRLVRFPGVLDRQVDDHIARATPRSGGNTLARRRILATRLAARREFARAHGRARRFRRHFDAPPKGGCAHRQRETRQNRFWPVAFKTACVPGTSIKCTNQPLDARIPASPSPPDECRVPVFNAPQGNVHRTVRGLFQRGQRHGKDLHGFLKRCWPNAAIQVGTGAFDGDENPAAARLCPCQSRLGHCVRPSRSIYRRRHNLRSNDSLGASV